MLEEQQEEDKGRIKLKKVTSTVQVFRQKAEIAEVSSDKLDCLSIVPMCTSCHKTSQVACKNKIHFMVPMEAIAFLPIL